MEWTGLLIVIGTPKGLMEMRCSTGRQWPNKAFNSIRRPVPYECKRAQDDSTAAKINKKKGNVYHKLSASPSPPFRNLSMSLHRRLPPYTQSAPVHTGGPGMTYPP
ncbi:hypothetical protein PMIN02_008845 [Paraphaeosphaeria minitans]